MCVRKKNYRLQDIQLSKMSPSPRGLGATGSPVGDLSQKLVREPEVRLRLAATANNLRWQHHSLPAEAPVGAKAGEYRARTGDLLVANQALSQLS